MMFRGESIRVELRGAGIAELCFDRQNQSVNKFDAHTVAELKSATEVIRGTAAVRGVLVTSAKEAFIVGADIFEFTTLFAQPEADIEAYVARQNAVFSTFEDLEVPSVAVINGLALGGGFEMALACDARVISESTQVGLPEVSLGLFPGFGGTVRLPRVTNLGVAIEWISSGKPQSASSALAAGAVDALATPDSLRSSAEKLLESLIASGDWRARRERRRGPFSVDAVAILKAKEALAKSAAREPAALAAVELMEAAAGQYRDEAVRRENTAFAKIARTQAASALIQTFINDQAIKKKTKGYAKIARKVQSGAVLGAGIMGGGIAYTSAVRGVPVVMKDIAQKALDAGVSEAKKLVGKQVDSGRMRPEKAESVLAAIRPTLDYGGLESVDIVVEAVVENMEVKKAVLAELENHVAPSTIIASNTSSLSITEMAGVLARPENFVGMHFFNPVPVMPLVEVIRGPQTSELAAATVVGYASAMGKTPIVVKECPGFLVNRMLTPYMIGFLRAVHDGADYTDIDRVMERFGWPMGPAYLQDVIGMDTLLHVLHVISEGFADRLRIGFPHAVELMVQHRRLGQKSGGGFYQYARDPKGRPRKEVDPETARLLASVQPGGLRRFEDEELLERLMLPMIIEAARCLQEGIAETAAEVDMSLLLGLGFPRHVGGALKYGDWLGLKHVVARCDAYTSLGALYRVPESLRAAALAGKSFY
jgi:3-hydroxyacyl-CoA dehydrogenase / enoyl-CoA hydratase / 3-hydroxybutyryl-CoA epimerase / enoyl-CoA isomerase